MGKLTKTIVLTGFMCCQNNVNYTGSKQVGRACCSITRHTCAAASRLSSKETRQILQSYVFTDESSECKCRILACVEDFPCSVMEVNSCIENIELPIRRSGKRWRNPLSHVAMQTVARVSDALRINLKLFNGKPDAEITEGNYYCQGCSVYLSHEPCIMCAMALLHSRVAQIFYCETDHQMGAFCTCNLHLDLRLNHAYRVFRTKQTN